jgi:hypothetical protein
VIEEAQSTKLVLSIEGRLPLFTEIPRGSALGNTVNNGEKGLAAYNHRRTEDL